MSEFRFPRWRRIAAAAVAAALVAGLVAAVDAWRFRSALGEAKRAIAARDYESAARRLAAMSATWPGRGEVEFLLGGCELARSRVEAALAAWGRVPADSPFAAPAVVERAGAAREAGRFAEAEGLAGEALKAPGPHVEKAREVLGRLLLDELRLDEYRALLRQGWDRTPDPAATLREYWQTGQSLLPIESVRGPLEEAAKAAPGDDRVWLGRARLALSVGQLDKAAHLLDACLERRPEDPAVWRARLDLALAADDPGEARRALSHLPADRVPPAEVPSLRAWFAAHRGDPATERRALDDLLKLDPGDGRALGRLADLEARSDHPERAAALRRRRSELARAAERYRFLLLAGNPYSRLDELGRLAETLGRTFEAGAWRALKAKAHSGGGVASGAPARPGPEPSPTGPTLADLLAELGPAPGPADRPSGSTPIPTAFEERAESTGLTFTYRSGKSVLRQLPETMGGGLGVLDYDGDGWLDVYAVQGGPFPPDPSRSPGGDRLFRNKRDGTFEDATEPAGLARMPGGYGHGVAVGDIDNDGDPDLFITRWRRYALYLNRGDGTFQDATESAGLGGDRDWPTSAAFADLDGDGDLDLYVCHYLAWDEDHPRACRNPGTDEYIYCAPLELPARPDHLFRNDGGRFVDVTEEAGIVDRDGRGLGVVAADLDGDGRLDLYVANDATANFLFLNRGDLRFEEVGETSGVAGDAAGAYQGSMGVACGDLDGDGRPDLAVTNLYGESTTFYRSLGEGLFADRTAAVGLAAPSRMLLGFGMGFLDANDDGRLDLATANGHVNDFRPVNPYAMPAQFLVGDGRGRLVDVSGSVGHDWNTPRVGRGMTLGDLDNDGRIDVLIASLDGPLAYFHNETRGGHRATFRLVGTASNRDAVGARVEVASGGRRQVLWRSGGGSYQSAGDGRLHVGLGGAPRIDEVVVSWPSGRVDRFGDLPADAGYQLREGRAEPEALIGFAR